MCRKICRKKIAVLDLTHGGIPIAKKLSALGNEVFGADVYGTVAPEALLELEEKHGIRCSKTPVPVEGFDLIVSPVHLDPASPMLAEARTLGKKVLSHHEIVGEILKGDPRLSGIRTVEVTGVKAKTSTASLLADMLSREYAVVLHTSRGLEAWGGGVPTLIRKGLSITPGSVLSAVDAAFSAGRKPDFFIFEISIGGTGTADLGILTTLAPDYGIANSTSLASEAKLQLVRNAKPGSTLLLNACAKNALEAVKGVRTNVLNVLTFRDPFISGPAGKDPVPADFVLETENETASPESPGPSASSGPSLRFIRRGQEIFSASLRPGYNISAYRTAFVAASAAALELGAGVRSLVAALEGFGGLAGRMQEKELAGITLIDNSNSGMDIRSAEKALEYALLKKKDEKKGGILLVLGEEAAQVCEGLPPESVQGFVEKYGIKCRHIVLVGERMQAVKAKNASYEPSLPEGLSKASELAGPEDIIISSVKCFR